MKTFKGRRSGFTLPEVLVTVAIIAIIAAAVVPAVTSQITKGEETTVVSAIGTTQTALTTFMSDVRSFPSRVSQLTTIPVATNDTGLNTVAYSAAQVARWKGPYTSLATFAADDSVPIGLGLFLGDSLRDSLNFVIADVALHAGTNAAATALAFRLEALFENTPDSTAGMIQWEGVGTTKRVKVLLTSSR